MWRTTAPSAEQEGLKTRDGSTTQYEQVKRARAREVEANKQREHGGVEADGARRGA